LVAVGASALQAADQSANVETAGAKPWSISATLRGFYDDNINSVASDFNLGGFKRDSWGFQVSPSLSLIWSKEQTSISAAYVYYYKYYENRPYLNTDNYDQDHTFNFALGHAFSERYSISVKDSFVVGQEPDFLRAGPVFNTFQRVPGSNIRNTGSINFDGTLTPTFGFEAGYVTNFYDYKNDTTFINNLGFPSASLAGLLNRIENVAHLDGRWQWRPDTTVVVGYQFSDVDYTGNQIIGIEPNGNLLFSKVQDNRSEYGYIGLDHTFRRDLTGSIRAGGRYNDYINDPNSQNEPSPYVMASLHFTYMPESFVEAGASYDRTATDLFTVNQNTGSITTDAQAASLWLSWNHRITPKLFFSVLAQIQDNVYNGGALDNETDLFYIVGLNLRYNFNPHFSAEIGYNYDRLDSNSAINNYYMQAFAASRSFDRNQAYIGVTATY